MCISDGSAVKYVVLAAVGSPLRRKSYICVLRQSNRELNHLSLAELLRKMRFIRHAVIVEQHNFALAGGGITHSGKCNLMRSADKAVIIAAGYGRFIRFG